MSSYRLQTLQSGLSAPRKEIFDSRFQLPSENSSDWRVWSSLEAIGAQGTSPDSDTRETSKQFDVDSQCLQKWKADFAGSKSNGNVCICGHPELAHNGGGLCAVSSMACVCRKPRLAVWVDDIRFFYRATKGPHEAHALVLGLGSLLTSGGDGRYLLPWVCEMRSCGGRLGVNPARFRNSNTLSLGMSVHDTHKLICEPCLFRNLNGGYVYE
jgi:hypothetical protein